MKLKYFLSLMVIFYCTNTMGQQRYLAYFECNHDKTYYVTEIQQYTVTDGLTDSRHFAYGFAEKMGWLSEKNYTASGKINFFNQDWLADNTKWRQEHIDKAIARGFKVVHITMPKPKVEKMVKVQSASQQ